jgi:hypothetical protein
MLVDFVMCCFQEVRKNYISNSYHCRSKITSPWSLMLIERFNFSVVTAGAAILLRHEQTAPAGTRHMPQVCPARSQQQQHRLPRMAVTLPGCHT